MFDITDCRFTAIPDNPKQFYDGYARIVRQCAPGTTFAPDICTCDGSSLINGKVTDIFFYIYAARYPYIASFATRFQGNFRK